MNQIPTHCPNILAMLRRAHEAGIAYPKIRLEGDVVIYLQGKLSANHGGAAIQQGGLYMGRIMNYDASFRPTKQLSIDVILNIGHLETDPVGKAKIYGQRTGNCCFCGRELSKEESVVAGYGPICAEKYGLPWGDIPAAKELPGTADLDELLGLSGSVPKEQDEVQKQAKKAPSNLIHLHPNLIPAFESKTQLRERYAALWHDYHAILGDK